MDEVKALFPVGKTQWRKWHDIQRTTFNEARADGMPFEEAAALANKVEIVQLKGFFPDPEPQPEPVEEPVVKKPRAPRKQKAK
jgi:hypothetical protein